jgi:NADPH:quinone reductase-like Zn-dependent oxidoreductase
MRALRFEKTGSLDYLSLADVPMPAPLESELLIKVEAAGVNPSDAKNVLGRMHETTTPRIPGRDFAGTVMKGSEEWIGRKVFGTGGNLGFSRDGSHADFVVVPREAVVPMPPASSFAQAAAIGLPYLTASAALIHGARLLAGETILILGTRGAVGSAAARLAHRVNARVIGAVRTTKDLSSGPTLPVDSWIDLESTDLAAGCRALTSGRGADVVLDTVGGRMFEQCLAALARRGRQIEISSGGMPKVGFDITNLYHNESRLIGVDSLKWGFAEAAQILRELIPAFENGDLPLPEVKAAPLESGPEVYRQIDAGTIREKVVLVP